MANSSAEAHATQSAGASSRTVGGVYIFGSLLTVEDCLVSDNTAESSAVSSDFDSKGGSTISSGGIYASSGQAVFNKNTVEGNSSISKSRHFSSIGGIYVPEGAFTLSESTVIKNSAEPSARDTSRSYAGIYVPSKKQITLNDSTIEGEIYISGNQITILRNQLSGGTYDSPAQVTLSGNTISGSATVKGQATISQNAIKARMEVAEAISITKNVITGSLVLGGRPAINQNFFDIQKSPDEYILHCGTRGGDQVTIDATNNWWGSTDNFEIGLKIYDFFVDKTRAVVNFEPFLLAPPQDVGPSTSVQNETPWDVNSDGVVNVFDLVTVGSQFGQSGDNLSGDVNGDGTVNVFDLVTVGSHFGESTVAAAPSLHVEQNVSLPAPNAEQIRRALAELEAIPSPSRGMEIAIQFLRAWLANAEPIVKETKLHPNYPNPFNPETWIPYQF